MISTIYPAFYPQIRSLIKKQAKAKYASKQLSMKLREENRSTTTFATDDTDVVFHTR